MTLRVIMWALKEVRLDDPTAKLILIGLADHAHDDGTASWPSRETLAEYAGVDWRTVTRKLQKLEQLGLIKPGDERLVAHIRADRRPKIWDVNVGSRGVTESPRGAELSTDEVSESHPVGAHGVSEMTPRGVRKSPKPKEEPIRDSIDGQSLPRDARGQRLDPSWIPDQPLIEEMKAERPDLDLRAEHAKFVDFWCSKPGKDGRKLDWRRTWRNWMRNAKAPANGHATAKPVQQRILCAVCQKPEIACRRVARQTGDDHEWQPQEIRA